MTSTSPVFEGIYAGYLERVGRLELGARAAILGIQPVGDEALVPFFGQPYRVSGAGVFDPRGARPSHSVCVIVCQYVLLCPAVAPPAGQWSAYRDFAQAAPFAGGFTNNVENAIARSFTGRVEDLAAAAHRFGGRPPEESFAYDLCRVFPALPRVPLLMLFNDREAGFPAQCTVLFEARAERFLDMECLAMTAWYLAAGLKAAAGGPAVESV
jgi:hypothetical protein